MTLQNLLSQQVADCCARAVSEDIGSWMIRNPLPAFVQPKYDGTRVWVIKSKESCVLATKHNGVYTDKQYQELMKSLQELTVPYEHLILDAEFMKGHNHKRGSLAVFDLIQLGVSVQADKPLSERIRLLLDLQHQFDQHYVYMVPTFTAKSTEEIEEHYKHFVNDQGFEGVVIKNPSSIYAQAGAWLKRKVYDTMDCFVTARDTEHEGYSFHIGALDKITSELVDMGKVGSFVKSVDCSKIAKGTVLEIQYQQVTRERHLRHPFVVRIREDKIAKECRI